MMTITPKFHREDAWIAAFCPELPEGKGRGQTEEEALASLHAAIAGVRDDQRKGPQ